VAEQMNWNFRRSHHLNPTGPAALWGMIGIVEGLSDGWREFVVDWL